MILIDNRTGSKELQSLFPHTVQTRLTRLQFGDFTWLGNGPNGPVPIGIERKTISDLVNCISDGRLSGLQLYGLLTSYYRAIIVVEGIWRSNPENGMLETWKRGQWGQLEYGGQRWMGSAVHSYLHRLSADYGVLVWATSKPSETVQWMVDIYHSWQKKWDNHSTHYGFHHKRWDVSQTADEGGQVQVFKPGIVERVACQFGDIREKRAVEIGKRFGSVFEFVMTAVTDEKEMAKVKGIGKGIARGLKKELLNAGNG